VYRFATGKWSPSWILRKAIENGNSYENALDMLMNADLTSNCYFTLAGNKNSEGVIIQRDIDISKNQYDYLNVDMGKWFLVQTNYDRNEEDPEDDFRRIPAEQKLMKLGKNIDEYVMFSNIMSTYPNNNLETLQTTIFSENFYNTTTWTDYN